LIFCLLLWLAPAIFAVTTFTNYSSSDYNGFRTNPGAAVSFQWNSPARGVPADFTGPGHSASIETRQFKSLADSSQATGQDRNSIAVDYDVFVKVPRLNAQDSVNVQKIYSASDLDFRLLPGSAPVDKGTALPNVTDGFCRPRSTVPHYGPRP
jgi:hypothetical protein